VVDCDSGRLKCTVREKIRAQIGDESVIIQPDFLRAPRDSRAMYALRSSEIGRTSPSSRSSFVNVMKSSEGRTLRAFALYVA